MALSGLGLRFNKGRGGETPGQTYAFIKIRASSPSLCE
jgi:hypothetical protein